MPRDTKLMLRMGVASSVLFAFYLGLVMVLREAGLGIEFIVAGLALFVLVQYLLGTKLALISVGAKPLPRDDFEGFYEEFESLAEQKGFSKPPRLMVAEMGVANAFAVGRRGNGTIVVSKSLLQALDFDEAAAVVAHELAHIDNRDAILMVLGESIASVIGLLVTLVFGITDNFLMDVIAVILGTLARAVVMVFVFALSRYREYAADRDAARAMGEGETLARALKKIDAINGRSGAELNQSVSTLCIHSGDRGLLAKLFATHPSVESRIERLQERDF